MSTSYFRSLAFGIENQRDRVAKTLPSLGLGSQLTAPGLGHAIELCVAASIGCLPFSFEPALVFEPVESGVEGSLPDLKGIFDICWIRCTIAHP